MSVSRKILKAAAGLGQIDPNFNQTTLLLHGDGTNGGQNNTFLDSSTNNFTITRNGNTTQGSFNPYSVSGPYDPATHGGSGYFDGTGDYLTAASATELNFGTGDFTLEAWVYPTGTKSFAGIVSKSTTNGSDGFTLNIDSGTLIFKMGTTNYSTGLSVPLNSFSHVAATRSGTTIRVFLNGVQGATGTSSFDLDNSGPFRVGAARAQASATNQFQGYISDARAIKGTALYTAAFTPPTAPLTAVSGTELLCSFTNAAIFDSTAKNVLETVGNAQIDTSVVKYGTGSMEFDGTGDWLKIPNNADFALGTGDFTIESWVYDNPTGSYHYIYDSRTSVNDTAGITIVAREAGTTGRIVVYSNGYLIIGTHPESAFYHMALTRSGSDLKLFVNGVQTGSTATYTGNLTNTNLKIGAGQANDFFMNGYFDDLRITKGVARYTAAFTPPVRAFPDR